MLGGLLVAVRDDGGELFGGEVKVADCVLLGSCGEGVFDVVVGVSFAPVVDHSEVVGGVDEAHDDVGPDKSEYLVESSSQVFCGRVFTVPVAAFDIGPVVGDCSPGWRSPGVWL